MDHHNIDGDSTDDETPAVYGRNWSGLTILDEFASNASNSPRPTRSSKNDLSATANENFILWPKKDETPSNGQVTASDNEIENDQHQKHPIPKKRTNVPPRTIQNPALSDDEIETDIDAPDTGPSQLDRKKSVSFLTATRSKSVPRVEVNDTLGRPGMLSRLVPSGLTDIDESVYSNPYDHENYNDKSQFYKDKEMVDGQINDGYNSDDEEITVDMTTVPEETESPERESGEVSRHEQLNWDVFRSYQYDTDLYACEGLIKVVQKVIKVVFIFISIVLILGTMVMSKLSLLYITSNMNKHVGFQKNRELDCHEINTTNTDIDDIVGGCSQGLILESKDYCGFPVKYQDDTEFELKRRDTIRWMWALLLCMCTPYLITFFHSMWKICFKHKATPSCAAVSFVMFMETLHIIGLMILCFIVLPNLDIFRAILLLNATAMYPSFMKMFLRPKGEAHQRPQIFGDIMAFLFQLVGLVLYSAMTKIDDNWSEEQMPYNCSSQTGEYYKTSNLGSMSQWLMTTNESTTEPPDQGPSVSALEFVNCGPGVESMEERDIFLIPVSLLLVSFGWWQNYVGRDLKMKCTRGFVKLNNQINKGKTKIHAIVSVWKIVLSFGSFLIIANFHVFDKTDNKIEVMEKLFGTQTSNSSAFHNWRYNDNKDMSFENDWLIVFGINILSGLVCYIISLHAIQASTQVMTYSIAVCLSTPVAIIFAFFGFCKFCTSSGSIAYVFGVRELYWNCYDGFNNMGALVTARPQVLIGIVFWVGQMILGRHLWYPKSEPMAKAGRIFVQPFYCGTLLEQSMVYNRSRYDKHKLPAGKLPKFQDDITPHTKVKSNAQRQFSASSQYDADDSGERDILTKSLSQMDEPLYDRIDKRSPMIFLCATMWHENEQEMHQMIKSIIRLDKDQCVQRLTRDYFKIRVKNFYDFEAHIFFDDAFEQYIPGDPMFKVNRFVELFVSVINTAASYVHKATVQIDPPTKIPTPYGGRLLYILPGGNKLILHLKDKQKIRHKKRWSQVMYLYYLFGYRLWNRPVQRKIKEEVAYNTFILTLDGDVDFKPEAVTMLVDLMKRNYSVGAACGRIHPEGHGPMVWYQKFEYAISHWLQKSTEHVLGCVLCSPGCFSLFRAAALMDDNIMKTYSKTAEGAAEHVQYDQGEDRWLCTLLLQRGYRVEYSAAADALTYAPEGFNEFFNQRRRWTPSTFANILDLLRSGRKTAAANENISFLYIVYQGGLLASSVLGPATIFLMTVGAFALLFSNMSPSGPFFIVLAPVALFFILCLLAPSSIQLGFAAILGGLFAIAQMVVLVSIIMGIANDGFCSPTTWFLILTAGIFLVSAILHPQEFTNVLHGILYFLAIPTMYLLLMIYSLCNLHVISWGTREVVQTKAEQERLKKRQLELASQKAPSGTIAQLMGVFGGAGAQAGKEDGWTMSCGSACRCLCCPRPGESPTDKAIGQLQSSVNLVIRKLKRYHDSDSSEEETDESKPLMKKSGEHSEPVTDDSSSESEVGEEPPVDYIEHSEKIPYWTTLHDSVERGDVDEISEEETDFWKNLIKRYLEPIAKNPEREERISKELKGLRNKAVIAFFMIDLLFIVLIQTLQTIPQTGGTPGSETNQTNLYHIKIECWDGQVTYLEPIGLAFLVVFGLFLIIQFFGMLFHRLFSLIQIVASTLVCRRRSDHDNVDYIELAKKMLDPPGDDIATSIDSGSRRSSLASVSDNLQDPFFRSQNIKKTNVIKRLESDSKKPMATMDHTFAKNFLALKQEIDLFPETTGEERQRRRSSVWRGWRMPSMTPGSPAAAAVDGLGRKKSVHAETIFDLAKRRSTVFSDRMARLVHDKFHVRAEEIVRARRKMSTVVPELNFNYNGGLTEDMYY